MQRKKALKILPVLFYGTGVVEWLVALNMTLFQLWFATFLTLTAMVFGAGVIPVYRTWKRKWLFVMYLALPISMAVISIQCHNVISLFVGIAFGMGELIGWYLNL